MLLGIKRKFWLFLVNKVYAGTSHFEKKRILLQKLGHQVGAGTRIVGPIFCTGKLIIGEGCWIGKNFFVNGNGTVIIGDNCDIAPEVVIQTGGHQIGGMERRAGKGITYDVSIGSGCWIGARSTLLGGISIKRGCVVAACSCVCNDLEENIMVGGVPAKMIRKLDK